MAGELEVIDWVIAQHQIVRQDLQSARGFLNDFEALFSLQRAQSGWAQSSLDKILKQKEQLQDALSRVQKGVATHFFYEEKAVAPIYGEVFTKALQFEHNSVLRYIDKAMRAVESCTLEGLGQRELLAAKARLQDATSSVTQMVEQHANLEEQMLRMLKRALMAEAEPPKETKV